MPVMSIFFATRAQEEAVKILFSGRCEWCDRRHPFPDLVLHRLLPNPGEKELYAESRDPQKQFLLLCTECHADLHRIPLPLTLQKDFRRLRPVTLQKAIREVFAYVPPPYQPPGEFDLAEIYEECFSLRSLDLFRAGG